MATRVSLETYERQRNATTQEQLSLLLTDPAFQTWQLQKAERSNRARVVTNLLAVASCALLVLTLMLLRPTTAPATQLALAPLGAESMCMPTEALLLAHPAEEPAGTSHASAADLEVARAESAAAWDAVAERDLALRLAEQERAEAAARAAVLEASAAAAKMAAAAAEAARAAEAAKQAAVEQRASDAEAQLVAMAEEVQAAQAEAEAAHAEAQAAQEEARAAQAEAEAAQAEAEAAASLAEATAAVAAALAEPRAEMQLQPEAAAEATEEPVQATPELPSALITSTLLAAAALSAPGAALYAAAAAALCGALALLVYLRDRRAIAAQAARAAAMAARLKEASFARDTAEKSLELLEGELQRRMKQLEEVQQEARDAASPKIGTTPSQPGMHTPGKGELPPPPASLVEKFLRDHNFLAVAQEQMQEWLEMEQQYREMQGALEELQGALAEREAQLAEYEQDLAAATDHHPNMEQRGREDQLAQVRTWLDEAQDELLTTQGALAEREAECRRVSTQLEALRAVATDAQEAACGLEGRDEDLLQQNIQLAAQLQAVTAAYEEARAQLTAAASGTSGALAAFGTTAARPASAASTLPGTPADLTREVASCLELMRATRAQLADRLTHSQGVCEQMIAECQQGAGGGSATAEAVEGAQAGTSGAFGSPAVASFTASERQQVAAAEEGEAEPPVLGVSRRHQPNLPRDASPSPQKSGSSGWSGSSCSPGVSGANRAADADGGMREAAAGRVAELRARHTSWDLAGFVKELGFQIEEAAIPVQRSEFEELKGRAQAVLAAAADGAAAPEQRALASEAMQAVRDWEWPVQRINTPPPSPFWRLLGLES